MERPENLTRSCGGAEDVREVLKISLRSLQLKKTLVRKMQATNGSDYRQVRGSADWERSLAAC